MDTPHSGPTGVSLGSVPTRPRDYGGHIPQAELLEDGLPPGRCKGPGRAHSRWAGPRPAPDSVRACRLRTRTNKGRLTALGTRQGLRCLSPLPRAPRCGPGLVTDVPGRHSPRGHPGPHRARLQDRLGTPRLGPGRDRPQPQDARGPAWRGSGWSQGGASEARAAGAGLPVDRGSRGQHLGAGAEPVVRAASKGRGDHWVEAWGRGSGRAYRSPGPGLRWAGPP